MFVYNKFPVGFMFQQIGELPDFFQNHAGGMIFSKIIPNFTVPGYIVES